MNRLVTLLYLLIGATLCIPLVAAPDRFVHPFIVPRVLAFRALVVATAAVWVVLAASDWKRFGLRLTPIVVVVLLFILSLAVSTVAGVDLYRSFHDTDERMLGLGTMLHFAAFFCIVTSSLRSWESWRNLLRWFLLVAAVVLVVAVWQKFDPEFLVNRGNPRVSSTLGHPSYLGGLGCAAVFFAALLVAREETIRARACAAVVLLLGVVGVLLSETRGSLLGLLAGLLVLAVLTFLSLPGRRWPRRVLGIMLLLAVAAGLSAIPLLGLETRILRLEHEIARDRATLVLNWAKASGRPALASTLEAREGESSEEIVRQIEAFRAESGSALTPLSGDDLQDIDPTLLVPENLDRPIRTEGGPEEDLARSRALYGIVYRIPGARRFARTTVTEKTARTRLMKWEIALGAAAERPLLGWGPNNYFHAFNRHYAPEFLLSGRQETWVDNAHNVFLNTLAVQGTLGLLAFLLLFVGPLFLLWRGQRAGRVETSFACVGAAFLVAHLVHNVFIFENPTSYLYFFLLLALLNARLFPRPAESSGDGRSPRRILLAVTAIAASILIFLQDVRPARGNTSLHDCLVAMRAGETEVALSAFDRSLSSGSPHRAGTILGLAAVTCDLMRQAESAVTAADDAVRRERLLGMAQRLRPVAHRVFDELIELRRSHSLDIRVGIYEGRLALLIDQLFSDDSRLEVAARELTAVLPLSPRRQEVRFLLADVLTLLRRSPEDVILLLQQAIEDEPRVGEGWWRLAKVYLQLRRFDRAGALLDEAERRGALFHQADRRMVEAIRSRISEADSG